MDPLRITGLASGMNIEKMVDKLMRAERIPLNQMKQRQQILEWRRDDYREMNKLLKQLEETVSGGIFRQSTFLQKTVTSTNPDAVTADAVNLLSNTTSQIEVTQLAKPATGVSAVISANSSDKIDPDATLASQESKFASGAFSASTFKFTLKVFQPDGTIAEHDFTVDPSEDSLNDVLQRINESGLGVTAFYDERSDQISIATNHTGNNVNGAEITVNETSGNFFSNVLQFSDADTNTASMDLAADGKNARFVLNGLSTSRTSNTFMINNITYTLKETTSSAVTLSTATDVDAIFDKIKEFVDFYNETIEKIHAELSEERYRDYPPLTDAQREEMSEHEIELWREKARSGMLFNDSILPAGLSQMRLDLYSPVQGVGSEYDQLSEIGIVTSNDYREHGKLIIEDPGKLRQAIADNPEAVYELFNQSGDSFETTGIGGRLLDSIHHTIERIELKAGNQYDTEQTYTIGRKLENVEETISDFQRRLDQIEDRYYQQFTRMEMAIQRANQQSAFLMNAFGPQ